MKIEIGYAQNLKELITNSTCSKIKEYRMLITFTHK